jgi:hypothetical protein
VIKPPGDPSPWVPWQVAIVQRFVVWVTTLDLSTDEDTALLEAYTAELQRLAQANGQALQQALQRHDGRN